MLNKCSILCRTGTAEKKCGCASSVLVATEISLRKENRNTKDRQTVKVSLNSTDRFCNVKQNDT